MDETGAEGFNLELTHPVTESLLLKRPIRPQFRSELVDIPEVKGLAKEDVIGSLAALSETRKQEIIGDNAQLLCFA